MADLGRQEVVRHVPYLRRMFFERLNRQVSLSWNKGLQRDSMGFEVVGEEVRVALRHSQTSEGT